MFTGRLFVWVYAFRPFPALYKSLTDVEMCSCKSVDFILFLQVCFVFYLHFFMFHCLKLSNTISLHKWTLQERDNITQKNTKTKSFKWLWNVCLRFIKSDIIEPTKNEWNQRKERMDRRANIQNSKSKSKAVDQFLLIWSVFYFSIGNRNILKNSYRKLNQ